MSSRTTLASTERMARTTVMRGTAREFDDKHLLCEVKQCDTIHGETKSSIERWQPVGLTSVPLKQFDDDKKKQQQKSSESKDPNDRGNDLDNDQPTGKAAEGVILHVMGQYEHAIGMFDDRRVRPYAMKPGETALYDASGTGQMTFFNDKGAYLVSVNNPSEEKNAEQKERFASIRHVDKQKQKREIKKGDKVEEHKHEGETVNTEVRLYKDKIEFRIGDKVVAVIDKDKVATKIETRLGSEDADHPVYGLNNGVGMTSKTSGDGAVLIKAPEPGPPTSLDLEP